MNNNKIIILLGLLGFIVMADNWVVSPILPAIAQSLGIPVENAGILISAYMIPFGIFQIIYGPLADRFGKKQIITFAILFFTVATGLCALAGSLNGLSVYRALTGIFAAAVMPICIALIGDLVPLEKRQMAIGTFMGIAFLGQGLSMITGGAISYFLSWRGVFAVYAVLSLIPLVLILKNYRHLPDTRNPRSRFLKPYKELLSQKKSLFTYILILLEGMFIIGSFSFLGAYISKTYAFNYLSIGAVMTTFGVMSIVGGRLGGKLVLKTGPRALLTLGLTLALTADLVIYFSGQSIGLLIFGIGLLGLGFIFAHSTLLTRATEFAQKARGTAMSLVAFCFMGGGGVGTALGGKIASAHGLPSLFLIYGVMLGITLCLSFFLIKTPGLSPLTVMQAESRPGD
ncbi:MAG: MFS transporter [Desulfobacula sp.]|nr:MFS transporter [Desulfobacula sp.]